ncbi:MAG: tRNA pseudouridine(55) synthase TruB [Polaromonas sp.]|nr:tRNA pseudouridine(55) synthase TruB [Polaromonas sp.]MBP6156077.1 tRNA pseudouridine(55) synthase TruB [Polaromonas sp.]MBP7309086.1 tRNA pseudouridine(55) synthase TruB [Polaromonas sp.]MBP9057202.1 tRNA pseudouridine(55) synthase TruB [Polaromonas sp.]
MSELVTADLGEGKKSKQKDRVRIVRRPVHGVLLLDKSKGISSNDALQKVKWLLRAEKAGHTGTLDPLATGLLPICLGAATKFSQMHLDADKQYEAIAQLGIKTSTGDAEGEVIAKREVIVTDDLLQSVLKRFLGSIEQVPPMHSALKKDGKALYEYARAGLEVERLARKVTIHALSGVFVDQSAIKLIVNCSKGTYIRTLAEDIGEALGCGAHLSSLRRTATGGFNVAQCITLEALEAMNEEQRLAHLLPVDAMLDGHVKIDLDTEDAQRFTNGLSRKGAWPDAMQVAVYEKDSLTLLGLGQVRNGELHPERLLSKLEIEQMNMATAH